MHINKIQAVPQTLYSQRDSINDAVDYIIGQMPGQNPNDVFTLLMVFQNTVLHQQKQEQNNDR